MLEVTKGGDVLCGVVCHLPLRCFGDAGGGCSMGTFVCDSWWVDAVL